MTDTKGKKVTNEWNELVISNNESYCGKILHFSSGAEFVLKYHIRKSKTWYISCGQFEYKWIDTSTAKMNSRILNTGDIVTIGVGQPHHIICLKTGDIFEVGTQDVNNDSYYLMKEPVDKKYKHFVLFMHMGLGDHIMMTPAVYEISKQVENLYIPCKTIYVDSVKRIYSGVKNLELLSINNDHITKSEHDRIFGELQTKVDGQLTVAATGMYNTNPHPIFPLPSGFYKDLNLDFKKCLKHFSWSVGDSALSPLLQILHQLKIKYIFIHDTSSNKKGDQIEIDARYGISDDTIMLNPDRNMYESNHPYYYLAKLAVRSETINIMDYIPLMENAGALYLIDSCYFCMTALIDISRVPRKYLYKRNDINYEWIRDDEWNTTVLT